MDANAIANAVSAFFQDYATNDLPKRLVDTVVYGGFATTILSLATGGRRRRELRGFLETHSDYIDRLVALLNYIISNGESSKFKDKLRPELNNARNRLKGKELVLYAALADSERAKLVDYLDRLTALTRIFEFKFTDPTYVKIGRFQSNIRELFEVDDEEGPPPVDNPAEHLTNVLREIVGQVYLFPMMKTKLLRLEQARRADQLLATIRNTISKATIDNAADFAAAAE
ncbi:MAG: hypothetical protein GC190_00990 [Alphaproteobacteria bacterium]|nr:hypothetical protein [Alphaproteobacteria bacterium]